MRTINAASMSLHPTDAKKLIEALISSAQATTDAAYLEQGLDVDTPVSPSGRAMTLAQTERQLDKAIRTAYRQMTGKRVQGDPVDFIYSRPGDSE